MASSMIESPEHGCLRRGATGLVTNTGYARRAARRAAARPGPVGRGRKKVEGLPAGFRYHDLRHYFASLLIAHGADVKTVQARLRHGSAKPTLDTYGHLWPDKDESTKAVIDALVDSKFQGPADSVRTEEGAP